MELLELLGIGGFGEVWKARNHGAPGSPTVALKFCTEADRTRFLKRERKVVERVMEGNHPGIVRLLKSYLDVDPPCLEYEYVLGGTLTDHIRAWHRSPGFVTPQRAAELILQLAQAVGYVHSLAVAVVHRDLKPANILVQQPAADTFVLKITDFGISALAAEQAIESTCGTTTGWLLQESSIRGACSPLYASPQQLRGEAQNPRDDIHALGVIWYQILTGDVTLGPPSGAGWRRSISALGASDGYLDLLESCCRADPTQRPSNGVLLSFCISELLSGRYEKRELVASDIRRIKSEIYSIERQIHDTDGGGETSFDSESRDGQRWEALGLELKERLAKYRAFFGVDFGSRTD